MINKRIAAIALSATMACTLCAPLAQPVLAAPEGVDGIRSAITTYVDSLVDPIDQFITDLYQNLLSRDPDDTGLASWKEVLLSGESTAAKVVAGFVRSREFKSLELSDEAYIATLYKAILGRTASAKDINAWHDVIINGNTRMKVLEGMIGSQEFKKMCEEFGIEAGSYKSSEYLDVNKKVSRFIAGLYLKCLGRVYDTESLMTWVSSIVDGQTTGTEAVRGFFYGQEMADRGLGNEDFVRICYSAILNRDGGDGEVASWVNSLNKGMSRNDIVESFLWSDEFAAYAASLGIKLSEKPKVEVRQEEEEESESGWVSLGTFKITAYCPCSRCNGNSSGITYSGTRLTVGRTVAVSRKVIPLGSTIKIDGVGTRVAEDTGVSGKTIDLLVSSHSGAYDWGVRYREVWIKK